GGQSGSGIPREIRYQATSAESLSRSSSSAGGSSTWSATGERVRFLPAIAGHLPEGHLRGRREPELAGPGAQLAAGVPGDPHGRMRLKLGGVLTLRPPESVPWPRPLRSCSWAGCDGRAIRRWVSPARPGAASAEEPEAAAWPVPCPSWPWRTPLHRSEIV